MIRLVLHILFYFIVSQWHKSVMLKGAWPLYQSKDKGGLASVSVGQRKGGVALYMSTKEKGVASVSVNVKEAWHFPPPLYYIELDRNYWYFFFNSCYIWANEQTLYSEEAQIFQNNQQDAGELLPICGGRFHLLCWGLPGEMLETRIDKLVSKDEAIIGQNIETCESVRSRRSLSAGTLSIMSTLCLWHMSCEDSKARSLTQ